jgi:hypothetical protein
VTVQVGITGTRTGCSLAQIGALSLVLKDHFEPLAFFHHGDCVGVDQEGWRLATFLGYVTVCHPPIVDAYRAFTKSGITLDAKSYMDRNREIVLSVDHLIVVPDGAEADRPRSGTWQAYRMAMKANVPVTIIRQDRW